MAYLDSPKTMTCPACGLAGEVVMVVGVGPHSRKGSVPYRRPHRPGPFVRHPDGKLVCPNDGTEVWRDVPTLRAESET